MTGDELDRTLPLTLLHGRHRVVTRQCQNDSAKVQQVFLLQKKIVSSNPLLKSKDKLT